MDNQFKIYFDNTWAWVKTDININKGRDLTLLTIGDSFTWGDELGKSHGIWDAPENDSEYRESKIFGKLLSDRLDSNWVQHALPGGSNGWCILEIEKILGRLYHQTKKLIVIFTMTEIGRELTTVNPNDEYLTAFYNQYKQGCRIVDSLTPIENMYWIKLREIQKLYPDITIICNYGFTWNIIPSEFLTEYNWKELCLKHSNITEYDKIHIFGTSTWLISQYLEKENLITDQHKIEICNFYELNNRHQDLLDSSGIYFKRHHPREEGHKIWANYLYDEIQKRL
jgi:lysophospholipase L1-like esterase